MREAIGGALLYYIIIPLLIVFIVFIGFIMRYASAYRAANYIVTQIESCQGYGNCSSNWDSNVLSSKYHYNGTVDISCHAISSNLAVYDVRLYVDFDLPLIGKFNAFNVNAETKSMHNTC